VAETFYDAVKLTPVHDAVEDRLRLNLMTQQGPVLAMWLTQRLGNQVVLALARWLDQEVKAMAEPAGRVQVQRFEQSAAVARHHPQPAVPAREARDSGLVQRVDLTRSGERYRITWVANSGDAARMNVDDLQLRQLLEIFRRVWSRAGWSVQGWPAWLARAPESPAVAKPGPLH
jgi:hypothetical protein